MTRIRSDLCEEIFAQAFDLPAAQRAAFIADKCQGNAALQNDVNRLLQLADQAGDGFLDPEEIRQITAAGEQVAPPADETVLPPGTVVGSYTISGVLGSGGMGVVYKAEQDRPRRIVALKVIRRGLGTRGILRRFEHEAEILGRLHHPGIAQIYEAGTATLDGQVQPFIAMEFVEGRTLNAFAALRHIGTRERLALFAKVCEAVHHAHQRGIIHRDLKPGNILVTTADEPKILDFGVARATHADIMVTSLRTNIGQLIGTLAYMSPEQVVGDPADIDVRSDVYSLGVILYELLTGRLPHDVSGRSIPEAVRMIREDPPGKLSRVSKVFRGEVDTIVHKALEKDPTRRYQSAAELGDDINRHLEGKPIHARQDSALYVLRKQLRRYRWAVIGAAVFIVWLVGFSIHARITASTQRDLAIAANIAQDEAMNERDNARATSHELAAELRRSLVNQGRLEAATGNTARAEDLLWNAYFDNPEWPAARWALWEMHNLAPIYWTRQGLPGPTVSAFSADGQRIALADRSGTLAIFDLKDGTELFRRSSIGASPTCLAFTHDGAACFVGFGKGSPVLVPLNHDDPVEPIGEATDFAGATNSIAVHPDGSVFVTGGADTLIRLWDAKTRRPIYTWKAHEVQVGTLVFSPDGTKLASAPRVDTDDALAKLWDARTGQPIAAFPRTEINATSALAFDDDGQSLYAGTRERKLYRCEIRDGQAVSTLLGEFGPGLTAMAEGPMGLAIVDSQGVRIWLNGTSDAGPVITRQRDSPQAIAWTGPTTIALTTAEGVVRLVDARPQPALTRISGFPSWCFGVDVSRDGRRIAIGPGGRGKPQVVDLLDTTKRVGVKVLETIRTRCIKFLPDSKTVLLGSADANLRLADADTGEILAKWGLGTGEIYALDIDATGSTAASGHVGGFIRIWDIANRTQIAECPKAESRVEGLAFAPNGSVLASSGFKEAIALWNPRTGERIDHVSTSADVWAVVFSPDGSRLLSSNYDGSVEMFDTATWTRLHRVDGHSQLVSGVRFAPDGLTFATCGADGTLRLWDSKAASELLSLRPGGASVVDVAFDPSGRYLLGTTAGGFTALYDLQAMDQCIRGSVDYQRMRLKGEPK